MRVLILGSGAREHAVAWKLAQSAHVSAVFAAPGNAGTAEVCTNLPDVDPLKFPTVLNAVRRNSVDCVFVGPETPLASGVVDCLARRAIPAFGPARKSAQLESSKAFSKAFLVRNGIPTARATEFSDAATLEAFLATKTGQRLVVKKSGLAAGKGVLESAQTDELVSFGKAALAVDHVLVEEYLEGWELSVFGVSDGQSHVILPACTDFKKAHDGDTGPNTGGMGSVCPVPPADGAVMRRIEQEIVEPTYAAMEREGLAYAGVLYFGLMITRGGPRVLEFNVRFGDPETQVLLPVLPFDFGGLLKAVISKELASFAAGINTSSAVGAALGIVIAGQGYPDASGGPVPVTIAGDALPGPHRSVSRIVFPRTRRDSARSGRAMLHSGGPRSGSQGRGRACICHGGENPVHGRLVQARHRPEVPGGLDMKDVLFVIGSQSDEPAVKPGLSLLEEKGLSYELKVLSAHRNLEELVAFLRLGEKEYRLVIAAAGLSAALPGVIASLVKLPVIGIPLVAGPLSGVDALLSILQLPRGVPVATMGIGPQGVLNAVHLAERILSVQR